ncbi:uncharacterized protein LOC119693424 isoform X3 [Plutella xylostella]|uniref:uncharacterized protein LOC119693424 isoform X3 n=1 Tax=Plutella xylostella TaxID=51655 RepID=UPI002032263F|nr:uncharacterized protein LOC119693424 isoform X3 [Plutella xylostella]
MANNSDKIDNSELKLLIKKRGSCKAQLTQFETFLSRLDGCDGLSELLKTELGIRMKKIELLQSDFDKLQCEIELLSDNVDEAYADRDQFESKLFRLLSVAHGLLAAAARYPAAGAPGGDGTSDAAEECRGGGFVRLPKIDLPHFDGDYQHWLSFRVLSTALVKVADKHGSLHTARLLLDNGSTSNFVTESLCEKLDLKRYNASSTVSDASERAYGSCVYIRTIRNDGTAHVCLLTSKNKVAPIKPTTIPRLELCGALLGTRLCKKVSDSNVHRLDRFQRIEFLRQHFWKRYCAEYVTLLQQKTKWLTSTGHLQVGSLVLVKDKTQPPLMWLMGRIVQLHPGKDGVSRVADIETKRGIIQRAYNNICPLPLDC